MDDLAAGSPSSPAPAETSAAEIGSLAREMAAAYARMVTFNREQLHMSAEQADATVRRKDDPEWIQRALSQPPDQVSWFALSTLIEQSPEAGLAAWERIKAEARDELASAHRVATTLEWDGSPWERARFLAIRKAFCDEWQPRGGIEAILIDQMAQAHASYLFWMERLHIQSVTEARREDHKLKNEGYWQPPSLDTAAAIDQSAAMADRFHRLFLRTLRALRDLRRYVPSVVVQNAGQVNVGGQQVNVARSVDASGSTGLGASSEDELG
jgi:hypothetical protein